jgi:hypothetical protein
LLSVRHVRLYISQQGEGGGGMSQESKKAWNFLLFIVTSRTKKAFVSALQKSKLSLQKLQFFG